MIPFTRLVRVELRKATDTRAGFWLLLSILLFTVLVVVVNVLSDSSTDLRDVTEAALSVSAFLLPVVGILLVSSEWSQRTHMTTFALVPRRERVLGAKFTAGLVLAVAAFVAARIIAAVGVLLDGGETGNVDLALNGQYLVYVAVAMSVGVAFGMTFLASAPAIVAYYVAPTALAALLSIEALRDAGPWLDLSAATFDMVDGTLSGEGWAQAGTAVLLWLVLPTLVGSRRVLRAELS